jgi:hypothetical protein
MDVAPMDQIGICAKMEVELGARPASSCSVKRLPLAVVLERSVIAMFHAIRANLPIICSVFLAAMVPQTSLGITATNFNNYPAASGLTANQITIASSSSERSRAPQAESRCQLKPGESSYLAQGDRIILCQRWLSTYILLRRVQEESGECFDEIVDTRAESILSREPVSHLNL